MKELIVVLARVDVPLLPRVDLAGSSALVLGEADPCAQAGLIAGRMEVVLASCNPDGEDVVVSVRIAVDLGLFGRRDALATARAGPVE
ncbi:hypothetical protein BH683_025805 [Williamsia sp. 1138]|uniref:flp pilus-assembly TadE/G-like family protein n=1 Tax=Williamsia sp. 1138 TaxID=1903117 RepID=UPI000A10220C|nr:flp pilus-assembly TadE/G-like family protein [Williamsia sp. 1138]OZG26220.1 hypothetical protein BH683_025805 [Williamsia sp. 1138]